MTEVKAKKASPLVELFRNGSEQKKRDMYARVIREATASQLAVEARAQEILEARRLEAASAQPELNR